MNSPGGCGRDRTSDLCLIRTVPINILVGGEGIGPSTSVLSGQRSTTELAAHQNIYRGSSTL